jgi:D-alanine-D-alanine ligase
MEVQLSHPAAPASSTTSVIEALEALGYEPVEVPLEGDRPADFTRRLLDGDFLFAFNLCESLAGDAAGEHLPAALVQLLGMPLTGAPAATLLYCLNKNRCAALLRSHGIAVPDWYHLRSDTEVPRSWTRYPSIVKPAAEDASNGVHSSSVVRSRDELLPVVEQARSTWGDLLIQEFIDGREINIAIVGNHVLPVAEIDFSELPTGSPPIVSYAAKWLVDSAEYRGTRAVCPARLAPDQRQKLLHLGTRAWELVDGAGYGRVDIRWGRSGVPYVIDVNPNPDLSPNAGLARQARTASWTYEELVGRIVDDALARSATREGPAPRRWIYTAAGMATGRTA